MISWMAPVNATLRASAASFGNTTFIDTFGAVCDENVCKSSEGSALLFPDTHHASEFGAELILNKTRLREFFPTQLNLFEVKH